MPVNVLSSSGNPIRFSELNKLMSRYNTGLSANSPVSSSGFRQFITKNIGNTSSLTANVADAQVNSKARGGKLINDDDPNLRFINTELYVQRSNPIKVSEFYTGQILSGSFKSIGTTQAAAGYIILKFDSSSVVQSNDGYKYFKYLVESTGSKIVYRRTNNPSPPAGWSNSGILHTQSLKRPSVATKFSIIDNTSNAFTSSFFAAWTGSGGGGGGGGGGGAIGCGSGSVTSVGVATTIGDSNTAGVSVMLMYNPGGPTKYYSQQGGTNTFVSGYITGPSHYGCTVASWAQTGGGITRMAHVMYRPATSTSTLAIIEGHISTPGGGSIPTALLSCPINTYENNSAVVGNLELKLWTVPILTTGGYYKSFVRGFYSFRSQTLTDLLTRANNTTALFGESDLSKIPIPSINPTTNFQARTGTSTFTSFNTFFAYFGYKKAGYYLKTSTNYLAYAELPADATNFVAITPAYYYNYIDGTINGTPSNTGFTIDTSTDYTETNIGNLVSAPVPTEVVKTNTLVKRMFNGILNSGNDEPCWATNYLSR